MQARSSCITTVVPYHRPIPEKKSQPGSSGIIGAWVQAEKMIQIVLLLPSAAFIGWLAGYGLDRWLHQSWIAMAGVVLGIISGLVGAIRMAIFYSGGSNAGNGEGDGDGNGNGPGRSGTPS
jgi:ATP synthase protein I